MIQSFENFLSPVTSLEPDRTARLIYGHFSSIGTRTSSACFIVFDNVPLWYVREEGGDIVVPADSVMQRGGQ